MLFSFCTEGKIILGAYMNRYMTLTWFRGVPANPVHPVNRRRPWRNWRPIQPTTSLPLLRTGVSSGLGCRERRLAVASSPHWRLLWRRLSILAVSRWRPVWVYPFYIHSAGLHEYLRLVEKKSIPYFSPERTACSTNCWKWGPCHWSGPGWAWVAFTSFDSK